MKALQSELYKRLRLDEVARKELREFLERREGTVAFEGITYQPVIVPPAHWKVGG